MVIDIFVPLQKARMSCGCQNGRVGARSHNPVVPRYEYLRLDGQKYMIGEQPVTGFIWAQNPRDGRRYQIFRAVEAIYLSCLKSGGNIDDCMAYRGVVFYGPARPDIFPKILPNPRIVGGTTSISLPIQSDVWDEMQTLDEIQSSMDDSGFDFGYAIGSGPREVYPYIRLDGQKYMIDEQPVTGFIWAQNPRDDLRYQISKDAESLYLECLRGDCMTFRGVAFYGPARLDIFPKIPPNPRIVGGTTSISLPIQSDVWDEMQSEVPVDDDFDFGHYPPPYPRK